MDKKQAAAVAVVSLAVIGAAAFFIHQEIYQGTTPTTPEEFNAIDDQFEDLDDYLDFENQDFDYDLDEIAGDWG